MDVQELTKIKPDGFNDMRENESKAIVNDGIDVNSIPIGGTSR